MIGEFERIERLSKDTASPSRKPCASSPAPAGARIRPSARTTREWSEVAAGTWLRETLAGLRSPEGSRDVPETGPRFQATLRPYQQVGLRWLHLLSSLGLGACLADDMGLGKTVQVLALIVGRSEFG